MGVLLCAFAFFGFSKYIVFPLMGCVRGGVTEQADNSVKDSTMNKYLFHESQFDEINERIEKNKKSIEFFEGLLENCTDSNREVIEKELDILRVEKRIMQEIRMERELELKHSKEVVNLIN